jgi:hypothetical protein
VTRTRAAGVLLAATLATSTPAIAAERAPALVSWKRTLCIYTGCFLEPLLPDARYESGAGLDAGWVLSWPIHPWATPPLDVPGPTLIVSPFLEPQLRLGPSRFRMLAGARVYGFPDSSRFGVLVEGAGLWGEDGRGGVLGVGLTHDLIERHRHTQPWTISLVGRRTWTDREARYDVSLDVTIPLRMFFGSPMDGAGP